MVCYEIVAFEDRLIMMFIMLVYVEMFILLSLLTQKKVAKKGSHEKSPRSQKFFKLFPTKAAHSVDPRAISKIYSVGLNFRLLLWCSKILFCNLLNEFFQLLNSMDFVKIFYVVLNYLFLNFLNDQPYGKAEEFSENRWNVRRIDVL